jgi:metal-responsive CopG/Arc/MetJ family transcriptional regulator
MWTTIVIDIHIKVKIMKAVQMTLDENLVAAVDRLARRLKTTRSAFARDALRDALARHRMKELEEKHRAGYQRHPVKDREFDIWEAEQQWGDE